MIGAALLVVRPGQARAQTVNRLRLQSVEVLTADSLASALEEHESSHPDVVVLDLSLADVVGLASCARVREALQCMLIVIGDELARNDPAEVLRAAADDYLARPYRPLELAARVRAALRRINEYSAGVGMCVEVGPLVIDVARHEVAVRGEAVELAPKEFELLLALASHPNELLRREELLARVWGYDGSLSTRTLDVHIGRIRKKIERDRTRPELILTVPRLGYKLAA